MQKRLAGAGVIIAITILGYWFLTDTSPDGKTLYKVHCGSCHLLPDLSHIPKSIWEKSVLPEMAARMGYLYDGYNPHNNSMEEYHYTQLSNAYPAKPIVSPEEWERIQTYVLSQAPDTVPNLPSRKDRHRELTQFKAQPLPISGIGPRIGITHLQFDSTNGELYVCDVFGRIFQPLENTPFPRRFRFPVTSVLRTDTTWYITEIGIMNPSEIPKGGLYKVGPHSVDTLYQTLHRPVYTQLTDLNEDGEQEILVCEYGNHTGELALLQQVDTGYQKTTLLNLPGCIKVEIADLNKDGKQDIVALFGQGREGVYVLYQTDELRFRVDQVIAMGPEYGSSWFELIDYNQDRQLDIVLANGDNADYSVFPKPYHGIRLFLNDGQNAFEQTWFYPLNGATQVMADDFDGDQDLDFAVLAFFPDFPHTPEEGFVYLESIDAEGYTFTSHTTELATKGNWLVMEKGDIDQDGDVDIFLGNFPLLTPYQEARSDIAVLMLENTSASQTQ